MDNKPYFIETKYDGERVLLHKKGDKYKYFSRRYKELFYDPLVNWKNLNLQVITGLCQVFLSRPV